MERNAALEHKRRFVRGAAISEGIGAAMIGEEGLTLALVQVNCATDQEDAVCDGSSVGPSLPHQRGGSCHLAYTLTHTHAHTTQVRRDETQTVRDEVPQRSAACHAWWISILIPSRNG